MQILLLFLRRFIAVKIHVPFLALFFLLFASSADAMSTTFGGDDDPSLHGATGSLEITGPVDAGTGEFNVTWSMDFTGYEGSVDDHQYLTNIAFKGFTSVSDVSLDGIEWNSIAGSGTYVFPSNVNNGGCVDGSQASFVCVELDPMIDATMGGIVSAQFTVTGDLDLSEWSYRGKFGTEDGWVISESSSPVPEPTAALVFGLGISIAGWRVRGRDGRA
jgi:hypothetical protein